MCEENFTKAQPAPREGERVRGNRVFPGGQGPQEGGWEPWTGSQKSDSQTQRQPVICTDRQLDSKGSDSRTSTQSAGRRAGQSASQSESRPASQPAVCQTTIWWTVEGSAQQVRPSEGDRFPEQPPATSTRRPRVVIRSAELRWQTIKHRHGEIQCCGLMRAE